MQRYTASTCAHIRPAEKSEKPWLNPAKVLVSSAQTRTLDQNGAHRKLAEKKKHVRKTCHNRLTGSKRVSRIFGWNIAFQSLSALGSPGEVKMVVNSLDFVSHESSQWLWLWWYWPWEFMRWTSWCAFGSLFQWRPDTVQKAVITNQFALILVKRMFNIHVKQ